MMEKLLNRLFCLLGTAVCPICGSELRYADDYLCLDCLRKLIAEDRYVCQKCHQPSLYCECGLKQFPGIGELNDRRCLSHSFYTGYTEEDSKCTTRLVYAAKRKNNRRLHKYIAGVLASDIRNLFEESGESLSGWICTFPPRSAKGYRKYGFDQGEEIARLLAKELGIPFRVMFVKRAGSEQKKAGNAAMRQENIENSLFLKNNKWETGIKVLLFDDVITSGATVMYAAELLYTRGAACVFPVCYARTKHDVE